MIYLVYRNYNGSWVIHGSLGVKVYYGYTKLTACKKYMDDVKRAGLYEEHLLILK